MTRKSILIAILCLGLITSGLGSNVTAEEVKSVFTGEGADGPAQSLETQSIPFPEESMPVEEVVTTESHSEVIATSNNDGSLQPRQAQASAAKNSNLEFNAAAVDNDITSVEVEQYFKEGYTLKDLKQAEELARSYHFSVDEVLQDLTDSGKTMEELKQDYSKQVIQNVLAKLQKQFPNEYDKIQQADLSISAQADLLALFSNYQDLNVDELIADYKENGEQVIHAILASHKLNRKPSTDKYTEMGLTEEEAQMYSDDMLDQLQEAASSKGVTVKALIKERQKAEEAALEAYITESKKGDPSHETP